MKAVYIIVCKVTGRRYVGSSMRAQLRWQDHLSSLTRGKHPNRFLQRAWKKYGANNFYFKIIRVFPQHCSSRRLLRCEQFYIDLFEATNPRTGFNLSPIAGRPAISSEVNRAAQLKIADVHRKSALAQWADPVSRAKRVAAIRLAGEKRRGRRNPAHSERMKAMYANSPELRARNGAHLNSFKTPRWLMHRVRKTKAAWAARRAHV